MKRTIIYTLFLLSFVCQQANATHIVQNQYDSSLNQSEHMSWWTHDRFGLFIHWGLYAMPARHEWVKSREKMSDEHYNRYKNLFNPDLYNPEEWAYMAKAAGVKYMVFTTKHHDGCCMWDSKYTDYKITNTPYKKDVLKPLVNAFRNEGIRIGFYYSLLDWHHPDFTIDRNHPQMPQNPDLLKELNKNRNMAKYREYMKNQLTELLTEFGQIDELFMDYTYAEGENGKNRLVVAEIDHELVQGATVIVEYGIKITNYSEIDYDYRKNKDYYYWGKEGGPKLENVIFKLVDYMSGGLILDKEKNSENELEWKELSADDLIALDGKAYIEESVHKDLKDLEKQGKGYTILETNDIGKIAPPTEYNQPGGTTIVKLYASKLLAVNETGVVLDNHAEIIETFKKIISPFETNSQPTTPGNHNPSTGTPDECDDGEVKLVITPPTGISQHTVNTNIILISSTVVLIIIAVGICLIKKNKKN